MLTPLKAIRAKCLDCCGSSYEVSLCSCTDCALHPFRLGKNPNRTGIQNCGSFPKKHGSISVSERDPLRVSTDIPQKGSGSDGR